MLRGRWRIIDWVEGGKDPGEGRPVGPWTFKDGVLRMQSEFYSFRLDVSAKPKRIDLVAWDKEFEDTDEVRKGVYWINGDILRVCIARPKGRRPKAVDSAGGSGTILVTLKKEGTARRRDAKEGDASGLFARSDLLYKRRDFLGVVRCLEEPLARLEDSPEVTRARYQLADAYRQIAGQEGDRLMPDSKVVAPRVEHSRNLHRLYLQKAASEFVALDEHLQSPAGKNHLDKEQRQQVPLLAARCLFGLSEYLRALRVYEKVIDRHPGKVEALDALGGAVSCHAALGQLDKVKERLVQIQQLLPRMKPDVREAWQKWLDTTKMQLGDH